MTAKLIAIIAVIIVGFIGIGVFTSEDSNSNPANATQSNNFAGPVDASVTLLEAGDFECPACASFHPVIKQIKSEYSDRVKFEFKHFPLTAIHGNALAAHRAAEAAAKQGKFWEMHDLLFESRNLWISQATNSPVAQLETFAADLELDIEKFKADFADPATNSTINKDIEAMKDLDVSSTPTFFLNGQLLAGREIDSLEKMREVLDAALADASVDASSNPAAEEPAEPAVEPAS